MAGLHFDITGDNKNFLRKLDEVSKGVKSTAKDVEREGDKITDVLDKIGKAMGTAVAGFTIKELVSKIAMVRSEFQKLEVAFGTMLGDTSKANELMAQLTRTAAITPFGLQDVAGGAKQLLAYGLAADKVNDTLIRLGDISAGLSIPLGDLVYLYGTTMTQGRLFTMDLRQFMGRGIPLAEELAKQFGVTKDEVAGLVTAGRVGFDQVQKAIESMTNAGGKFGGLMEAQSKTIGGQISNLEDAVDMMFNELGKTSEGLINTALSTASALVENYESVGKSLVVIATTYGAYKAALVAVSVIESARVVSLRATAMGIQTNTASVIAHTVATKAATVAQAAFNAVAKMNPYVLLTSVIVGAATAVWAYASSMDEAKMAEESYAQYKSNIIEKERKHREEVEKLIKIAENESVSTDTRREALIELNNKYPEIFQKYKTEYEWLQNIKNIKEEIAKLEAPKSESETMEARIKELEEKEKSAYYETRGSAAGAYKVKVGGLTQEESLEYNMLKKKLQVQKRKEMRDAYFANLTGISNNELEEEIKRRETLLAQMKLQGKEEGEIRGGRVMNLGVFSETEIQAQLNLLKAEQNKRAEKGKTPKQYLQELKKAWLEADKAYNDFINNTSKELSEEEYKKQYETLKSIRDTAKKAYEDKGGSTTADRKTAKEKEKQIEAEKKAGEKLLKLIQDNAEAEVSAMEEGKEKKLKALENEYDERKFEIEKQVKEFSELNKKSGATGLDEQGLTQKQSKAISEALLRSYTQYQHDKKELEKQYENERIEALYNYLTKYGDVQEQIYAITTYYNQKIAEEKNAYNQASLAMERDEAIKNIQANEQRKDIDWSSMFGNIELYSVEKLQSIKEEIRKVLSEDNSLDVTDKKDLIEQYNRINDAISDATFNLAKFFGFESEESDRIRMLKEEYELRKQIVDKLKEQQKLAKGKHTADKNTLDDFLVSAGVVNANKDYSNVLSQLSGNDLNTFNSLFAQFQKSGAELTQLNGEVANASQAMESAGEAAQGAGQGFASAFATTDKIIHTVNANVQSTAEFMKEIGRENTKAGKFITKFAESSQYATDAFDALKSGNFAGVVTALHGALRTLGDSLGELGIAGFGSSDTTLHDDMERLSEQNKALANAMESLSEELKNANFSDSADIFRTQLDYLEKAQDNRADLMLRSALAYSNGFLGIGGKSSSASKVTSGLSIQEWKRLSEITGETVDSGTAFFKLSAEQMKAVATYAPDLYAKIKGLADEGYENASQYMDEYISYGEELDKLQDAYNEKMTNISFDSFRDEFKGALTDMEMTAEKFAENFEELLVNAIAESLMTEKYDKKIKELYEKWVKYAEDGFTTGELADLQKDKSEIYDSMEEDRKFLDMFREGSTTSQSANRKGLESFTQEQGDEFNGRVTALQLAGESIKESMLAVVGRVDGIYSVTTESNEQLKEIRNLVYLSTGYLEDIAKHSKPIGDLGAKLDKIIENTKGLV